MYVLFSRYRAALGGGCLYPCRSHNRVFQLLLKVDLEPHEPYSPPPNMYLWWGPSTNHRFVGSGEHIRHLLHLGQIEGGEWRDPMFLGNNGVATFR